MQAYIIRRVLLMIPTLIIVTVLVFLVVRFVPGTVLDLMVSDHAGESGQSFEVLKENLKASLGLDVPVYVQYGRWIGILPQKDGSFSGILEGSLGK